MKRIIVVLVDEKDQLVAPGEAALPFFRNVSRAEKEIERRIKQGRCERGDLKVKRLLLDRLSRYEEHLKFQTNYRGVFRETGLVFVFHVFFSISCLFVVGFWNREVIRLLGEMEPTVSGAVQSVLFVDVFLASLGLVALVFALFKLLKRLFFFVLDVSAWMAYKRADTKGVELVALEEQLYLNKVERTGLTSPAKEMYSLLKKGFEKIKSKFKNSKEKAGKK
ncbi:hypothetical protein VNN41_09975 [Lactococcus garvieae]|uniref:hypothetical protein n=1 Tax=Lactococcus garvieae TaxID=1363 RepID=UPI00324E5942